MSEQVLKEQMLSDALIVHLADSMEEIHPRISEQPDRFVVVLDDEEVPLHVTTGSEMKRKMPRSLDWPAVADFAVRLPEALLVDENVTLDQAMIFFSAMSALDPQPPGLVVVHDGEVLGVLPYEALNDYYTEEIVPTLRTKAEVLRKGEAVTIASAVFRCRRYPRCSHEETASQVDSPPLCRIPAHGHMVLIQ